ncbi:hypothetical protein [Kutzneria buriramensis]|uniref:Uncharacterized protein n=1 Tax=Kutzneria buriramensis TaxID=1045776 RepID=A0A3E0GZZ3_9PSEU|nr:hypothetical protein [Kutzneria buriramensis]REH35721.1 hypothetical protein BCF44_117109 [Kutzneria buriramensis]
MRRMPPRSAIIVIATAVTLLTAQPATAAPDPTAGRTAPAVITELHHDTSPVLQTIKPRHAVGGPEEDDRPGTLPHAVSKAPDPVRQSAPGSGPKTEVGLNFDGVGQGFTGPGGVFNVTSEPPDPNSAVGASQVVEIVNSAFAVFAKTGAAEYGPATTNTLFTGFGGPCETTDDGDAVVRYDTLAGRWVLAQFANVNSKGPYYECVAVSQTSDATGAYNRYSFQYNSFPDYPKLSVWPDAYYVTYNLFDTSGTTFLGAESCALNRAAMLAGQTAVQQCFTTSNAYGGILPADVDGGTAPPTGAPNVQMALGTTNTTLVYWRFHVDWTTPANTTFTGPTPLTVAAYTPACGTSGTCVPQADTTQQLDALSDRLMYRLAYRNFGDHQSLVVSHSVAAGGSVGERWYEFRLGATGDPTVFQQGTYAPDATYRWLGSAAMDKAGNLALGYTASAADQHPSIRLTGRIAADPPGQLTQAETTTVAGDGSQTKHSRWGDYSSMSVDPVDNCTFWYTHEYLPIDGDFTWRTRDTSFTLPGCTSKTQDDFSVAVNPGSAVVTAGKAAATTVSTAVTSGSAQQVNLAATGLPAGTTASFNPTSVTAGGSSTLTITTSTLTPSGSFPITVVGTGPSATHVTSYLLTVESGNGGISNGGFETADLTDWKHTGTVTVVHSGAHSGAYAAQAGAPTPTKGDSTLTQTFTVPTGSTALSFWYDVNCPDQLYSDWATATLKDNTTGVTTTPLAKTCTDGTGWQRAGAKVVAGHRYTLTLTSHDDNYTGDATYTLFDDVTLTN